jgi:hypothetical protein
MTNNNRDSRNYSKGYQQAMADIKFLLITKGDTERAILWVNDNLTSNTETDIDS